MALGIKLIPLNGINLDVANAYLKPNQARYIKNLYYQLSDTAEAGTPENSETGKLKPIESNAVYCPFELPNGINTVIGTYSSRETKELYVFVHNSLENHFIFRLNGLTQTADVASPDPCFNFQLSPEFFIGEGQCYLDINTFVDPDSGNELQKKDLYWTDGYNYQGFIRFEDYLATNGFDPATFPYFDGVYDRCSMVRVGFPTPKDCVTYTEIPHTLEDEGLNNELLFHGTQVRITGIDVFGRPTEHGIISDLYIPGVNDCVAGSNNLPRCLMLSIDAGNPLTDKLQVEFSQDNELQWYVDGVINLYVGSSLGEWWLRPRNPDVDYDPITNRINYQFCRNKECTPIDQAETNKLQPALSKRSQALGKVGQRMGMAANKYGFNPFPQSLKDKIHLTVTPPKQQNDTLRDITIYVCINSSQGVKHQDNQYYFGGGSNDPFFAALYKQLFPLNQKGWIGYLSDGSYTISTQWYFDLVTLTLVEDVDYLHGGGTGITGPFVLQKFFFPKKQQGSYVFRLADHEFDLNNQTTELQRTSTTVFGLCPFTPATFKPFLNRTFYHTQELLIDTCTEDYNTLNDSKILVIMDCASFESINMRQSTKGYITEDIAGNIPVELISVDEPNASSTSCLITDHNGFYWYIQVGSPANYSFGIRYRCGDVFAGANSGAFNGMEVINVHLDENPNFQNYSLIPCNREEIKGRVVIQGTNIGVPNVIVTLTRTTPVTTDAGGFYTIIAHDYFGQAARYDSIVLGSSCGYLGLDGSCLLAVPIVFSVCSICDAASPPASPPIGGERILQVPDIILQYLTQRGLMSGGTFGWVLNPYDYLGRKWYGQLEGYFTIPSIIQSQTIGPSTLTVDIDIDAIFPPEVAYFIVGITAETTQSDRLDWIVDNVVFVNNTGDEVGTPDAATQIKIYYGSIIEFAKQNNYNVTTQWQFIASNGTSETSDKIQFFINGDGQYFTKTIIGLVKYDLNGQYVLIDYTSDLRNLKANAYIRLLRPKVCTGNEPFYEICSSKTDVVDGKPTRYSFILNAFDTYYLSRQIPVPVLQPPVPPATEPTYINELRIPGTRFEHHSPSNIWGYKIWNRGRLNTQNPYEAEILQPNEIQLSGTLSPNGKLTYIQNYDESFKHNFIINNSGGITYFRVKSGIICFILGYNNFVVGYNDNLARLINGNLQVPSGDSNFGNPERRTNGDYGCTLFDKNTIREREGLIHFLDASRVAILQHNFNDCIDVSRPHDINDATSATRVTRSYSSIISWLQKKIKYIQEWNRTATTNKKYFHAVINPANFEYQITDFTIGSNSYVNQERGYDVTKHESFSFDIYGHVWKGMYSATPEYFGYLEGEKNGQQLFLFKNSIPHYQYKTNEAVTFGTVFGETVERVYEFILTTEIMKKLRPLWLEVYCKDSGYYSDRILTEAGQTSRILKAYFKQGEYMTAAPFLRATNTPIDPNLPQQQPNVILEGNPLFGEWVQIRLIGYPESNTVYSQLSGVQIFLYGEENTGKGK